MVDVHVGNVDGRRDRGFSGPVQMARIVDEGDLIEWLLSRIAKHFLEGILSMVSVSDQQYPAAANGGQVYRHACRKHRSCPG